jgi:uncharacterized membrane protein YcaP (DUF421 family)
MHSTNLMLLGQADTAYWVGDVLLTTSKAVVIYAAGLMLVRFGARRMLGRATAFDVVLGFLLGSLLSRAINGTGYVAATVTAACVLVAIHYAVSAAARRWSWADTLFKGVHHNLILDGEPQARAMRQSEISDRDLYEALRQAGLEKPEQVAISCMERSGKISVIPARREPKVLEVQVEQGVQTVRIELS